MNIATLDTMRRSQPLKTTLALFAFLSALACAAPLHAASQVLITEFMAANNQTLADEDGSYEDWIEICNLGSSTVNLAGWALTDDPARLNKWQFPDTNLVAGKYMVVWASNKNRRTPGAPLHTNFKLDPNGEFLALVEPDGTTIASQFSPFYPVQVPDVSFGYRVQSTNFILASTSALARVLVPSNGALGLTWALNGFNDSGWQAGTNGVGFETGGVDPAEDGYASAVFAAAPLACWRFDEASGITVLNSGSLGAVANATCQGGVAVGQAGPRPPAYAGFEAANAAKKFDGVTGRVQVPANPAFDFGMGAFSIVLWFNPANPATRGDLFTLKGGAGDFGIHVASVTANTVSVFHNSFIGTGGTLVANQWYCLVFTRTASGACAAYLNGASIFTGTSSQTMSIGVDLLIGSNHNGTPSSPAACFNGLIDEVAIYNRALSADEAVRQYQAALSSAAGSSYAALIKTDLRKDMFGVNSSVYVRIPFLVTNVADLARLTLRMQYDDGFVAYLNGIEAMSANAPTNPTWSSTATNRHPDQQALAFEEFDISDMRGALVPGTNILAIQGLNIAATNADFLLLAELSGSTAGSYSGSPRYFTLPTPGKPNGAGTADLGPIITQMGFIPAPPAKPLDNDPIVVTARVTQGFSPVTNVTLRYRVMYGVTNTLPMLDDGAHGDGAAGDGIYGAIIPASASTPGQMVRFCVIARDDQGRQSRWPLFDDPLNSPEYLGTVIADPTVTSPLPVWEWFTADVAGSRARSGARGSVWYQGSFYDNVFVRQRGGFINLTSQKFDFNTGDHCWIDPITGSVEEANLNAEGSDPSFIRQPMAFESYRLAGHEASVAFHVLMRLNGGSDRVGVFVEQVDARFMDRNGLDREGALYKFVQRGSGTPVFSDATDGIEKKSRNWENNDDLQAFVTGLNQTDAAARRAWFFDNLNVPQWLNFLALRSITQDADDIRKNFYLHRDTLGTGEWRIFPWDKDWTFGVTGDGGSVLPHPFFGDYIHRKSGDQWNKLYEFVFNDPVTQPLYLRRLRSVMDQQLQPPSTPSTNRLYEKRSVAWMQPVAALLGSAVSNQLAGVLSYFPQRRTDLYVTYAATNRAAAAGNALVPLPAPDGSAPWIGQIEFNPASGDQGQEFIQLTNPVPAALDISGWRLDGGVRFTFQPGTVMPSNGVVYVSPDVRAFRARTTAPRGGQGLLVVGPYAGQLSAWGETVVLIDPSGRAISTNSYPGNPSPAQRYLRITEIMYNPAPMPGVPISAQEFEYLEFRNTSASVALDLSGVHFTNGLDFSFTGSSVTTLAPGERVLIVRNTNTFALRYGGAVKVAGQYGSSLDNAGERLTLLDAANEQILDFTYNNSWYPLTDGLGFSLVVVDDLAAPSAWDLKENWRASSRMQGSPGAVEMSPIVVPPVVVNEALTRAENPSLPDVIELHNPTSDFADISGWYLTDKFSAPYKFRIPDSTVLPPHGYVTFDQAQFDPLPGIAPSFGLASGGDSLFLFAATSAGELTGYAHGFTFGAAEDGVTFGRYVASDGRDHFVAQIAPTLVTNNLGPRVGPVVINEIMYHPPDIGGTNDNTLDEFIELLNIAGQPLELFDRAALTNTWHLRGGVGYDFPTNFTLAAGQYALLVSFPPTNLAQLQAFRTRYSVPGDVPVLGPYSGKLNNGGDTVELKKPALLDGTNAAWVLVDAVEYSSQPPWPCGVSGSGASLQRQHPDAFGDDLINWGGASPTAGKANASVPLGAPVIMVAPADRVAAEGGMAVFSLSLCGTPPYHYQWFFNGASLAGETNATLTVSGANSAKEGPYFVTVSNAYGAVTSSPALFYLAAPPVILRQPESLRVTGEVAVSLLVPVKGPPPMVFQWRFNGTNLPWATSSNLVFSQVGPRQAGTYSLAVTNAYGWALSSNATLEVDMPCTILDQPQSLTFSPGTTNVFSTNTAVFSATVASIGPPSLQWTLWGTNLPGATNATLVISNVALAHCGPYALRAADQVRTAVSSNAWLRLLVKPFILVPIQSQRVVEGGTASFSVWAGPIHPTLPLTYQWMKNGIYFATNDQSTLVVSNVAFGTNYYLVRVANDAGFINRPQVSLAGLRDSDHDGVPDEVELALGYATNNPADGKLDYDGDGMSNADEVVAGTDPKDSNSVLRLVFPATNTLADGQVQFWFSAVSNKSYSVQFQSSLDQVEWTRLLSLESVPTNRIIWLTNSLPPALPSRFYRVRTPLIP